LPQKMVLKSGSASPSKNSNES